MTDFKSKNETRTRCRLANREKYAEGRKARKAWATGGAFGRIKKAGIYIACATGTTAIATAPEGTEEAA